MTLEATITGIEELTEQLETIENALDVEEILDISAAFLLNQIRTRFLRQEAPDGSIWEPSAASFQRAATGRGGGTLFDTGTLWNSLSVGRFAGGRTIFTEVEYAPLHNFGLEGFPQREFLGFNEDDEQGVENIVNNLIQNALRSL